MPPSIQPARVNTENTESRFRSTILTGHMSAPNPNLNRQIPPYVQTTRQQQDSAASTKATYGPNPNIAHRSNISPEENTAFTSNHQYSTYVPPTYRHCAAPTTATYGPYFHPHQLPQAIKKRIHHSFKQICCTYNSHCIVLNRPHNMISQILNKISIRSRH